MIAIVVPLLIEATLRALLVALTVWAGLSLLRVANVLAQKAAWALVLLAALAMLFVPLAPRSNWLPGSIALRLPALLPAALPSSIGYPIFMPLLS